jgi:hypothetical protein
MGLNKPNQQLRRDLKAAASALDYVAHELFCDVDTQGDAAFMAFMEKIVALHKHIDVLRAYADEVTAGRIVRRRDR